MYFFLFYIYVLYTYLFVKLTSQIYSEIMRFEINMLLFTEYYYM